MNLLGLLFDGGLAILLCVTIGYCSRLSRRIRLLQDNRSELAAMIAQFDQATGRAATSLSELQTVSKRITDALQLKIEKANFLADDLAFLIEKSTKLITQIEQTKSVMEKSVVSPPKPATELYSLLQGDQHAFPAKPKPTSYTPVQTVGTDIPTSVKSAASLEALLNRLASSTGTISPSSSGHATVKAPPPKPSSSASLRTDAERELLEAIKSGR